jgi:hypothetical protein
LLKWVQIFSPVPKVTYSGLVNESYSGIQPLLHL